MTGQKRTARVVTGPLSICCRLEGSKIKSQKKKKKKKKRKKRARSGDIQPRRDLLVAHFDSKRFRFVLFDKGEPFLDPFNTRHVDGCFASSGKGKVRRKKDRKEPSQKDCSV